MIAHLVTIIAIICWCLSGVYGEYLCNKGRNNKFGWDLRYLPKANPLISRTVILAVMIGPLAVLLALSIYGRYCWMTKEQALQDSDNKDIKEYGWHVGKMVARKEGRLPEGELIYTYEDMIKEKNILQEIEEGK